jgi:hypothetical protein
LAWKGERDQIPEADRKLTSALLLLWPERDHVTESELNRQESHLLEYEDGFPTDCLRRMLARLSVGASTGNLGGYTDHLLRHGTCPFDAGLNDAD